MNRLQWILLVAVLCMVGGAAGLLGRVSSRQRLAPPGVKTHESSDPRRLVVDLPEQVLDYTSEWVEVDEITRNTLPADTSFGQRRYEAADGFGVLLNVVLMGTDRTSLHKPQFCLEGQGWRIDQVGSLQTTIPIDRPTPYDLPVVRLLANREAAVDGQQKMLRGVYVYWFVADDALSASVSGVERMWMMGSKLLRTGVLQRWAYVSCFSVCLPGQEEAAFERMKRFIVAAVPEFQHTPRTSFAENR